MMFYLLEFLRKLVDRQGLLLERCRLLINRRHVSGNERLELIDITGESNGVRAHVVR